METSKPTLIVADTSGLVSLFHPLDKNHQAAVAEAKRLRGSGFEVIVPVAVYLELLNVLGRVLGHQAAIKVAQELSEDFLILNNASSSLMAETLRMFQEASESVSHTDCFVMATCDEFDTREIFGFDRAFTRFGYSIIQQEVAS
ncbi:type II toxin-antitoxin system VapC family toxin [Streptomyces noursei]|uniref:type II toxin-antitoxin system VapC family toxin n=1 Tax=Streptomyces noursei TaxID=1971 RepID=UPI0033BFDCFE